MEMTIKVKTLSGSQFDIKVNPVDTVDDVKQIIENAQEAGAYPKTRQMLFYRGSILKDGTTLDENNVMSNTTIVLMLGKDKSSPGEGSSTAVATTTKVPDIGGQPLSNTSQSSFAPTTPTLASGSPVLAPIPSTNPLAAWNRYGQAASNLITGNDWEQTVQQIVALGRGAWDRATVVNALHVSRNNPLLAFAYFLACVPEHDAANPSEQSQPSLAPSSGPNTSPLNLWDITKRPVLTVDILRYNVEFLVLRAKVQAKPEKLQQTLHKLKRINPGLLGVIKARPIDFLSLMNEIVPGIERRMFYSYKLGQVTSSVDTTNAVAPENHAATDPVDSAALQLKAVTLEDRAATLEDRAATLEDRAATDQVDSALMQSRYVTPEDRAALARLERLGFRRATVERVYFDHNREEFRAMFYLIDYHLGEIELEEDEIEE